MIDWERVYELRDEIGPEDFGEVVDLFLSEVEERLETLRVSQTLEEFEGDYHFLKGSSLNLGFRELAKLCDEGEHQTISGGQITHVDAVCAMYEASKLTFLERLERDNAA